MTRARAPNFTAVKFFRPCSEWDGSGRLRGFRKPCRSFDPPERRTASPWGRYPCRLRVADKAVFYRLELQLNPKLRILAAVQQDAGMQARANFFRSLEGLLHVENSFGPIIRRDNPFCPVVTQSLVRHESVQQAVFNVLRALTALVGDDCRGLNVQILVRPLYRIVRLIHVVVVIGHHKTGDYMAFMGHGGLHVVADLQTLRLVGHHSGVRVAEGQLGPLVLLHLPDAGLVKGSRLLISAGRGYYLGQCPE